MHCCGSLIRCFFLFNKPPSPQKKDTQLSCFQNKPKFLPTLLKTNQRISVADPDQGSGIRCHFDPWIRVPEWVYFGSLIPDLGSRIPNSYF